MLKVNKKIVKISIICLILVALFAVSASAALDRIRGAAGSYNTEALLYNAAGGYRACTYINPNAKSSVSEIWAKVRLIIPGDDVWEEITFSRSNEVDTPACTTDETISYVYGYHYVELDTGDTWGSKTFAYTVWEND